LILSRDGVPIGTPLDDSGDRSSLLVLRWLKCRFQSRSASERHGQTSLVGGAAVMFEWAGGRTSSLPSCSHTTTPWSDGREDQRFRFMRSGSCRPLLPVVAVRPMGRSRIVHPAAVYRWSRHSYLSLIRDLHWLYCVDFSLAWLAGGVRRPNLGQRAFRAAVRPDAGDRPELAGPRSHCRQGSAGPLTADSLAVYRHRSSCRTVPIYSVMPSFCRAWSCPRQSTYGLRYKSSFVPLRVPAARHLRFLTVCSARAVGFQCPRCGLCRAPTGRQRRDEGTRDAFVAFALD